MGLAQKTVLAAKGESKFIPVKEVSCIASWLDGDVGLDLMVLGKDKDDKVISIYTNLLPGGNLGDLNSFPFIKHFGDEGVAKGDAGAEKVVISKIDDNVKSLDFVINNYTAEAENASPKKFKELGLKINFKDNVEEFEINFDNNEIGDAALICRIENEIAGAKLTKMDTIIKDYNELSTIYPQLKIWSK